MAPGANSYGTAAQVAIIARAFTNGGAFDATTNPTLDSVEDLIDDVSSTLNVYLAGAGFVIPVTQADAKAAIARIVVVNVAEMVRYANNAGRFHSEKALAAGLTPDTVLDKELAAWVEKHAAGLVALGAARNTPDAGQVAYRDSNEAGESTFPLFQRDAFDPAFKDWDP